MKQRDIAQWLRELAVIIEEGPAEIGPHEVVRQLNEITDIINGMISPRYVTDESDREDYNAE